VKRVVGILIAGIVVASATIVFCPFLRSGAPFRVLKAAVALLAAAGAGRVALGFGSGEHLRRAWSLFSLDYGVLAGAQLAAIANVPIVASVGITVLVNGFGVAATIYFARAHALAGLDLPGSRARQRAVFAVTAILALLLVGVPFVDTLHVVQAGNLRVLINTVSSIGDLVTFTLIGPILLTALALRGGLLVWPWAFLVGCNIAWFLQDAASLSVVVWPSLGEDSVSLWSNLWQVLACLLAFAAALAQERVSSPRE
jgi:hypothetical protein